MRHLKLSCTIGNVDDDDNTWSEELDVYLKDSEGMPHVIDPNIINNNAERELKLIVDDYNRVDAERSKIYKIKASPRILHGFIILYNRNYE